MEVGHAHISTLHLMVFQGHTNGHIKVEVEEGGSKQTVNSSNICSYGLTAAVESSCTGRCGGLLTALVVSCMSVGV